MRARDGLMKRWALGGLMVALIASVSGCGGAERSEVGGGISVGADPADLIEGVSFVNWEDLPVPVSTQEVYHQAEPQGGTILPGSEPRRLLVLVWGNRCMPAVAVAAPVRPGLPQLSVSVVENPTGQQCGEALVMYPFEVILTRDVDPASVVLEARSQPS